MISTPHTLESKAPVHGLSTGEQYRFLIPYQTQNSENLSIIVGFSGSIATALTSMYFLFVAVTNPVLGWLAIATIWTTFAAVMVGLWFAVATDNG